MPTVLGLKVSHKDMPLVTVVLILCLVLRREGILFAGKSAALWVVSYLPWRSSMIF